jgi:hypothetical protein
MARAPANFRESDLDRAIRVAEKNGLANYEITIEGARVTVRVGRVDKPGAGTVGSWDDVVAGLERGSE